MSKFRGGVKEAAKLLLGLPPGNRKRVLEKMREENPQMAEEIEKNLTTFEDLIYLTPKMMSEFFQSVKISDLALSLKICSEDLKNHFLKNTTKNIRQEIMDTLNGPPVQVSKVQEAKDAIMKVVLEKVDKGELVLSNESFDTYV
jgi:flagellar motor switch protein FliG